jgi:hypothetical protein
MPFKSINEIKSVNFTTDIPKRAKFVQEQIVHLGRSSHAFSHYPDNKWGSVVGFQRHTQAKPRSSNRYYVKMWYDGRIWPIDSMYLLSEEEADRLYHTPDIENAEPEPDHLKEIVRVGSDGLRDEFAKIALSALIAKSTFVILYEDDTKKIHNLLAKSAWGYADAMIENR